MPLKFLRSEVVLSDPRRTISGFPATLEERPGGKLRLWYTALGDGKKFCGIHRATEIARGRFHREAFAVSESRHTESAVPLIDNLPASWNPVQPVHLALPDGTFRLYFWCHCYPQGIVRFLTASSRDDLLFHVEDPLAPCVWHYCDRCCPSAQPGVSGLAFASPDTQNKRPADEPPAPAEMVCNDATTVYLLPDGTFELYSAAIRKVNRKSPEYVEWDNAAGYRRYIVRYTSRDGVHFTPCGPVIEPDEEDPPYLQFYYLSVAYAPDGRRLGFLGLYDVMAQTADVELCTSEDGIHWRRSRRTLFPRRPQDVCIYAEGNPLRMTPEGFEVYYSAFNYQHNHRYRTQPREKGEICKAVFSGKYGDLFRFAGGKR